MCVKMEWNSMSHTSNSSSSNRNEYKWRIVGNKCCRIFIQLIGSVNFTTPQYVN